MRADPDPVALGQPHGVAHVIEVRGVETASDVGYRDQRHQSCIVAEAINAKSLAHVAVDDGHATPLLLLWPCPCHASRSDGHDVIRPPPLARDYARPLSGLMPRRSISRRVSSRPSPWMYRSIQLGALAPTADDVIRKLAH